MTVEGPLQFTQRPNGLTTHITRRRVRRVSVLRKEQKKKNISIGHVDALDTTESSLRESEDRSRVVAEKP